MEQEYQDKSLKCKDCGEEFIWTAGEQEFFFSRGFKNKPARCKECRKKNRQKVETEYFRVTCSVCRQVGDVLFKPANPEAKVYCKNCFETEFLKKEAADSAVTSQ
ncbi:MAG: zinc-ribbon domain-containing protein [Candidatus Berkelbacteria bacterium]|nr:MAG: zinc-ribbon domain-containing protein [Candidatus Berkelbacteria bacterium]QQG51475.1 MAG: zinc-ribbon domain-containing protein [Candidatus Berkelbacteria bacterium]